MTYDGRQVMAKAHIAFGKVKSKKKEKVYHPSFQKLELSNHLDSFLFHTSICDILT
jgi:hypothetical protein